MTAPELAEHLDKLERATEEDYDEFLELLLAQPYQELEQQNN
jgi:hypothetical protein